MDANEEPELSPLELVALEAMLDPFCPMADDGEYQPESCLPWCHICESLLIHQKEKMI